MELKPATDQHRKTIVFFDGYCGLCNHAVNLLLRLDSKKALNYAPLQGITASVLLPQELFNNPQTIVVFDDHRIWTKSEAVFRIIQKIGGIWSFLLIFKPLPVGIMNWGYDLVSRNRHRLFKPLATCRLPSADEADRFLS